MSGFGFEEKFSVMSLSNRLDDRQAQTGSLDSHRSVADRAPADRVELVGGDAPPALVANPDVDLIADRAHPPRVIEEPGSEYFTALRHTSSRAWEIRWGGSARVVASSM